MDTTSRTTTSTRSSAALAESDPTSPGRRAAAKLTSCPQCAGDVVATPMTRVDADGARVVTGWACPLHGGPLPLH